MTITKRSVKGSDLTPEECDANMDELIALLTRMGTFAASQTPGANNIPVLDASGILKLGGAQAISPSVSSAFGPSYGNPSQQYTPIYSGSASYQCCNCRYNGSNWVSLAAGNAVIIAATTATGGAILYTANPVPTAADQVITWDSAQLMTVPAADSWTAPTLLNGFVEVGGVETVGYRKCAATNNFQARGIIKNTSGSTIASDSNIFAVPSGYLPAGTVVLICPMTTSGGTLWTTFAAIYCNPGAGFVRNQTAIPNNEEVSLNPLGWFVAA